MPQLDIGIFYIEFFWVFIFFWFLYFYRLISLFIKIYKLLKIKIFKKKKIFYNFLIIKQNNIKLKMYLISFIKKEKKIIYIFLKYFYEKYIYINFMSIYFYISFFFNNLSFFSLIKNIKEIVLFYECLTL